MSLYLYAVTAIVLWLLWKLLRNYFVSNPLARFPGPPSPSIIFGNLYTLFASDGLTRHQDLVAEYGAVSSIRGALGETRLYITDIAAMYSVLMKDHDSWDMGAWVIDSEHIFVGPGLLSVRGDVHRKQRKMLTPVFSIKHLRNMTPVFYSVAHNLVQAISSRVEGEARSIDVLSWMSRTALEMIGQSGMGYSFDPLVEDVADEYSDAVKNFIPFSCTPFMFIARQFSPLICNLGPRSRWFLRKAFDMIPAPSLQRLAQIIDILQIKSTAIFEEKKRALQEKGGIHEGTDIMSIMLKANMESDEADKLTEDQLVAQISTILFAAMDTTSNALSKTLELLSTHPKEQTRLRQELLDASHGEDLEYDALDRLPFLDAICRETLRVYPPVTSLSRDALKDTVIPLSEPVRARDGTLVHEIPVPRGTSVFLGVDACNRSKALWGDDAEVWRPERWLQPMPEAVVKATVPGVYSHLMTFSGGNRACIGFKLSQLEMKLIISVLVQNFVFERGDAPIFWNLSGVNYPSLSKESLSPEMWLTVRKV